MNWPRPKYTRSINWPMPYKLAYAYAIIYLGILRPGVYSGLLHRCNRPEYTPAGVYRGIVGPRPFYTRGILWRRPIHTPSGHNIPRGINCARPQYNWI